MHGNDSSARRDLRALKNLIDQADLVLATISNPHPSIASARESLNAALALSKDLADRFSDPVSSAATLMGARGGSKTAERGPELYTKISAMRTKRSGGRPRKNQ